MAEGRTYVCIDLKCFYASVECVDRGLDPFAENLVVADPGRTEKTICLAISPALKARGVANRCRVFEIPPGIDYIMARPRMRRYMEVSADIYSVYLRYVSPEDIHPYSIDECFIDATPYLALYRMDARSFAVMLMDAVRAETGICATAGIGTNLFLAKVALDITAKHVEDNIGYLDQAEFERTIQTHRPITDIWNVGPGIARRLAKYGVHDLLGVCQMDEATLYREFGVNAEYLIDHAHGVEPCTMAEIHAYEPGSHSVMSGQVLPCGYRFEDARDVLREMVDQLVLDLAEKHLVADSISLYVGYAREQGGRRGDARAADGGVPAGGRGTAEGAGELSEPGEWGESVSSGMPGASDEPDASGAFGAPGASDGPAYFDGGHGRRQVGGRRGIPHTGGTRRQPDRTSLYSKLLPRFLELFDETTRRDVPIRRINVGFGGVLPEEFATLDLFADVRAEEGERRLQQAMLAVKGKFGKNALLRGTSLKEKATARERNEQVGGHHA